MRLSDKAEFIETDGVMQIVQYKEKPIVFPSINRNDALK